VPRVHRDHLTGDYHDQATDHDRFITDVQRDRSHSRDYGLEL
jgi:hypothetical protein